MMISIWNDGKGNKYSYEAWTSQLPSVRGFGESQDRAILMLQEKLTKMVNDLLAVDYSQTMQVDMYGYPLDGDRPRHLDLDVD